MRHKSINLKERLKKGPIIIDGAMGTMLQKTGLGEGQCNEEWNLSHADVVTEIHRQYIEAGAEIILTNTFGGSPMKLGVCGFSGRMEEINTAAVNLAKKAVGISEKKGVMVAGDVGPCGELLEPLGTFSRKDFYNNFKAQADALAKGGADLFVIETMTSIEEAEAALEAAKESGLPVIVSMSFNRDAQGDDFHTMMGVGLEKMASALKAADGLGVNCGGISFEMVEVIRRLRNLTDLPLMAEPNAGLPRLVDGKTIYDLAPQKMAELGLGLKKAGANIIGGCCGTTPAHINAISRAILESPPR